MRTMRHWISVIGLVSILATPALALGPYGCEFQSHSIDPPYPAAFQPFTIAVTVFTSCFEEYGPPASTNNVVTIEVWCGCAIGTPPPPTLQTFSFVSPGLAAGTATVEFVEPYGGPIVFYTFGLNIGSLVEIPTVGVNGSLLLAFLLLAAGLVRLKRRA